MKKIISMVLSVAMLFTMVGSAMAANIKSIPAPITTPVTYSSHVLSNIQTFDEVIDGVVTSSVSFMEGDIPSFIKTEAYPDGRFIVTTTINGQTSIQETVVKQPLAIDMMPRITYPYTEPEWYGSSDKFSTGSVISSVGILAAVLTAGLSLGASEAVNLANAMWESMASAFLGWTLPNLYFWVDRYYSYTAISATLPVTWHNRFVTNVFTHSDFSYTHQLGSTSNVTIDSSDNPM